MQAEQKAIWVADWIRAADRILLAEKQTASETLGTSDVICIPSSRVLAILAMVLEPLIQIKKFQELVPDKNVVWVTNPKSSKNINTFMAAKTMDSECGYCKCNLSLPFDKGTTVHILFSTYNFKHGAECLAQYEFGQYICDLCSAKVEKE